MPLKIPVTEFGQEQPFDWTGMGTMMAGAGSVMSALGLGSQGNVNAQHRRQLKRTHRIANNYIPRNIKATVKGAQAAGIHPLALIGGGQGFQSSPVHIDGQASTGAHYGDAVQAVGRTIAENNDQAKLIRQMENDIVYEQLQGSRLQNAIARKNLQQDQGTKDSPIPLFTYYKDQFTGKVLALPNEAAAEAWEGGVVPSGLATYGFGQQGLSIGDK